MDVGAAQEVREVKNRTVRLELPTCETSPVYNVPGTSIRTKHSAAAFVSLLRTEPSTLVLILDSLAGSDASRPIALAQKMVLCAELVTDLAKRNGAVANLVHIVPPGV